MYISICIGRTGSSQMQIVIIVLTDVHSSVHQHFVSVLCHEERNDGPELDYIHSDCGQNWLGIFMHLKSHESVYVLYSPPAENMY